MKVKELLAIIDDAYIIISEPNAGDEYTLFSASDMHYDNKVTVLNDFSDFYEDEVDFLCPQGNQIIFIGLKE